MRYYVYNGLLSWFSRLDEAIDYAKDWDVPVHDENDNIVWKPEE